MIASQLGGAVSRALGIEDILEAIADTVILQRPASGDLICESPKDLEPRPCSLSGKETTRALRAAGLVSRSWSIPFLSRLWRNYASIRDLLAIATEPSSHIPDVFNPFGFPEYVVLKDTSWHERWRIYAKWLARVQVPSASTTASGRFYRALAGVQGHLGLKNSNELLPGLRIFHISCIHPEATGGQGALHFVPPNATLRLEYAALAKDKLDSVLCSIAALVRHLEKMEITRQATYFGGQYAVYDLNICTPNSLSLVLLALKSLRYVVLPIDALTLSTLWSLAALPRLESFEAHDAKDRRWFPFEPWESWSDLSHRLDERVTRNVFPSLSILRSIFVGPHSARHCLHPFRSSPLVELSLRVSTCGLGSSVCRATVHQELFLTIANFTSLETLHLEYCLAMKFQQPVDEAEDSVGVPEMRSLEVLPAEAFKPLKKLKFLEVQHPAPWGFGGDEIVGASKYWGSMKQLILRDSNAKCYRPWLLRQYPWEAERLALLRSKPKCCVDVLPALLKNMPRLERLDMDFTTHAPSPAPNELMELFDHPLRKLVTNISVEGVADGNAEEAMLEYLHKVLHRVQIQGRERKNTVDANGRKETRF